MNELTKIATPDSELVKILQNSLYPGAKAESVALVLAWCKATGRDPMKRPIHIVPMYVRKPGGGGDTRDVLMPGIGTYRTDAADTGEYVGKDEPVFGPDVTRKFDNMEVTFPAWCKVTVHRYVHGQARPFTALEFWTENYATGKDKKGVNDMWAKRAYGQLAKCAEAQALRMAFPDQTGNTNTAEEMEGKEFAGQTIEGRAEPAPQPAQDAPEAARRSYPDYLRDKLAACSTPHEVAALRVDDDRIRKVLGNGNKPLIDLTEEWMAARLESLMPAEQLDAKAEPMPEDVLTDDDLGATLA